MHRSVERIVAPETVTPSGDLLLVRPEKVGNVADELKALSDYVKNHETTLRTTYDDYLFNVQFVFDTDKGTWAAGPSGKLALLGQEAVKKADEHIRPLLGNNLDSSEATARVRAWYHDEPTPNATPHIDEGFEGVNSLRAVAAWPTGTLFAKTKRIRGIDYANLTQANGDFGTVPEQYHEQLHKDKWIQAEPGDLYMFSGVGSIHTEPLPDETRDTPRVLIDLTYRFYDDSEKDQISNPYIPE